MDLSGSFYSINMDGLFGWVGGIRRRIADIAIGIPIFFQLFQLFLEEGCPQKGVYLFFRLLWVDSDVQPGDERGLLSSWSWVGSGFRRP